MYVTYAINAWGVGLCLRKWRFFRHLGHCCRNSPGIGSRNAEGKLVLAAKKITPTGGGDPVSVILSDWQLGGGVPPVRSVQHWEEECAAPNSVLAKIARSVVRLRRPVPDLC